MPSASTAAAVHWSFGGRTERGRAVAPVVQTPAHRACVVMEQTPASSTPHDDGARVGEQMPAFVHVPVAWTGWCAYRRPKCSTIEENRDLSGVRSRAALDTVGIVAVELELSPRAARRSRSTSSANVVRRSQCRCRR